MNIERDHVSTVSLTTDPEQHPAAFAAAFNTGDPAAVQRMYEPEAVFVPRPGAPVRGASLAAATLDFLALGLPIEVRPRHTYTAGDIALLIVDWTIDGPGPDGEPVHLEGTATDVARRGADGLWRYVIDNPFGAAAG
ncbi:YybH family protein [Streptomyces sp. NPDC002990]